MLSVNNTAPQIITQNINNTNLNENKVISKEESFLEAIQEHSNINKVGEKKDINKANHYLSYSYEELRQIPYEEAKENLSAIAKAYEDKAPDGVIKSITAFTHLFPINLTLVDLDKKIAVDEDFQKSAYEAFQKVDLSNEDSLIAAFLQSGKCHEKLWILHRYKILKI